MEYLLIPNASITSVTGTTPLCIGGTTTYLANGVVLGGGTGVWSSSNTAVATVSVTGLVTGITAGTCNIIYTITGGCGGTVSAQQAVVIRPNASITSVTGTTPLCIGGTATYAANGVVLSGGTGAWSSSNAAVATVSAAGLVTGITAGTANIIYTITGGCGGIVSAQQSVVISPNASITSVTGTTPLCIGGTATYVANGVVLSGGTGAWSSSNTAVATVSAAGLVTGITAGTCNIIYTITGGCGGTVSAQQAVVISPNASITSVTGTTPLCIGGTATYTANGVVLSGGTGAWSSSNAAVATVSAAGLVTGITAGTCNIIYTITGGCGGTVSAQQSVVISPNASITSVTGTTPLCIGGTATYTANGVVLSGGTGAWSSSNAAVATVSAAGLVTGITAGTCNIIYTITGGCGGTVSVQQAVVISPNASITSVTGTTPLCIGGTATYTANGVVLSGGTGAWSSSNGAVATVSAAGLVTGLTAGTCNIIYTITGGCGGTVSAQQTVVIRPNASITSVTGTTPLCIGGTATYLANGVVLSGGTGAWSSSNAAVATVSATGLVTGITAGTSNIIYTITGGCGGTVSAQQAVVISPNASITSVTGPTPLCIGGTATYTANGIVLSGGTGAWSSSNAAVATVSAAGLVTGITAGTANIIYTITGGCGGIVSAQQSVVISPNASITSVTGTTPLCIGGTATYLANGVVLSGGTGAWSSSNTAVATVSTAGLVTGITAGTSNIIYTITGGCGGIVSAQQAVVISPNASITSVTGTTPLCIGGTATYTANGVVLSGGTGAWSSSNAAVATVSAAGLVTGITAGTCNIIYTITGGCGGTVSAQQSVVISPNASITSVTGTTPLCIGGTATYTANGVVLSGGTGAWSSSNGAVATVSAVGLVTGITAGTCNIIYTITGGCGVTVSAQQSLTILPNASITSVTGTTPLCIGGTATYSANGVVPGGGTGAWSSSNAAVATVSATGLVTGITAGTANIIYTITGGCGGTVSAQQAVVISPNASITSVTGTTPLCIGGTATYTANGVVLSGGTGLWSSSNAAVATVSATGVVTGITSGICNIIYTITGGCGVTVSAQQSLTIRPNASITSVTGTTPLCIGGTATYAANGVVLSGGTGAWSSSNTAVATVSAAGLVTGITAGTCNVIYTITGGCGGTVSAQQSLTIRPNASITSVTGVTPLCIGGTATYTANGVVLSGGAGAWSSSNTAVATVSAAGLVTGITAGTSNIIYTITGGCGGTITAQQSVVISPNASIISVTGTTPLCIGGTTTYAANGVVLSGGTGSWSSSNNAIATVTAAGLVTGVSAGSCNIIYTVTGGCGGLATASAGIAISAPPSAAISYAGSPMCSNAGVQSVTFAGTGGGTFNALPAGLSLNPVTGDITPGTSIAGTYAVTYTMVSAECGNRTATTNVTINQSPAVLVTDPAALCFPLAADLTAVSVTAGSTPGLTFTYWTDAAATIPYGTPSAANSGIYYIKGTDVLGCFDIKPVTVVINPAPAVTINQTNVLCSGESNGAIDITVTAGTGPFTFAWTGAGVVPASEDQSGLASGIYSVVVTDALSCSSVSVQVIITEPIALSGSISSQTNVTVYAGNDGSVTVDGAGGTAPYSYSIDGGSLQASGTFGSLTAGTYTITVFDINLCSFDVPVTITEPIPPLTGTITSQTDVVCFGASTGSVTVEGADGVAPYEYSIDGALYQPTGSFGSLVAGTYTVTIKDAAGMTFDVPVVISQPAVAFTGVTSVTNVLCFGEATGSVDLAVNGGVAPYSYLWSNGSVTEDLSTVAAGTYTVTITDALSCVTNGSGVVTEPLTGLSGSVSIINAPCSGVSTGAIDLTVSGGTSPYTFLWSNGDTTEDLVNIPAGDYSVTITDANDCTSTANGSVVELSGTIDVTDVSCNGGADGSLELTVTGGLAPFNYLWNNGAITETISGLVPGNYTVTITDASGCSVDVSGTVAEPEILDGALVAGNVLCFGESTGWVDLTVSGGTSPYSFLWDNGATSEDLTNVASGDYHFTITDAKGCTYIGSATVGQPLSALAETISAKSDITCKGSANGSVTVSGSGGTLPYEYSLNGGSFGVADTFIDLDAGTYIITVRDANLCTADVTVTFTEPSLLEVDYTKVDASCPDISDGRITLVITGGSPPYSAYWEDGTKTLDRQNLKDGTYSVAITDLNGCAVPLDIVLEFSGTEACLVIPTIITPNGDSYNDTWIIKNIDLFPNAEVFIFNRWGELVFHTKNLLENQWDGTLGGKLLPTDSYHYVLHLNNGADPRSGVISIIK